MSTYFNLYCKHKNTDEKPILLLWLSTTAARELASEVGLKYSYETVEEYEAKKDGYISLSKSMLEDIVDYYKDTKKQLEKIITDDKREAEEIFKLLPSAVSDESYNRMTNHRDFLLSGIMETEEHLQFVISQYNDFSFILNLVNEKENQDLELFYYLS